MDESDFWSLGGSSSFDGEFNPGSLGAGIFDEAGSLGGSLSRMHMDVGGDEEELAMLQPVKTEPDARDDAASTAGPDVPQQPEQPFVQPLSAGMCVSKATQELLNKIYDFQRQQRVNLGKLRQVQRHVLAEAGGVASHEVVRALGEQIARMVQDTRGALQALVHAWCIGHLSPMEIWRWDFLWLDLQLQLQQLDVYAREAAALPPPHAALAVVGHPFPRVAARGRPLEGPPLRVQLLTGAGVAVLSHAHVRARLVIPPDTRGRLPPDVLERETAPLAGPERVAALGALCFASGTRKQPVHLQMELDATLQSAGGRGEPCTLQSPVLPPCVGVTNEVQWEEAEGMLVERRAFMQGPQQPCPWSALANHLQRHLVDATRQHMGFLHRIFSRPELAYFQQQHFGGAALVQVDQLRRFWKWYGKAIHKIRYTKHFLPLFLSGHLFGFIGKQDTERLLSDQLPGTFLLRFSQSAPGAVTVAYVAAANAGIRHYLIPFDDMSQRKGLADFLAEAPALTHFLRFQVASGFNLAPGPDPLRFERRDKLEALRQFLAARDAGAPPQAAGYDPELLNVAPAPATHEFGAQCWDAE